ncbi:MAG: hypothetical protein K0R39_1480 [Symbiobacteriaceae bacterium]|nr:hypothetical protein [Symbiobacteriaceae bacterium]
MAQLRGSTHGRDYRVKRSPHVTDPNDSLGFKVVLVNGRWEANIAEWLFEEGLAPEPGINEKFDVAESPNLILGLPALCFNTDLAQDTKHFDTSGTEDHMDDEDES